MKEALVAFVTFLFLFFGSARHDALAAPPWKQHGQLQVTRDGHYLQHKDGTPFFWLADTAWHLRGLSKEDIDVYLKDRAAKGFNVVMADFLSNRDKAFVGKRPHQEPIFDEAWWSQNDYIVDQAARCGLYVVVIGGWGGALRELFANPAKGLFAYGQALGSRYKNRPNIMYFVAAEFYKTRRKLDGEALTPEQKEDFEYVGKGIRSVDKQHLISIHGFPDKGMAGQPSQYFQHSDWCDFYAVQTHNFQELIKLNMTHDWSLKNPTKPTVNAEGGYEGCDKELHPWLKNKESVELFDKGWGQRFQAYWSVFLGGMGFAYGHDNLWHMTTPDGKAKTLFLPALEAPGAKSMRHLRALMESRILSATPDVGIVSSDPGTDQGSDKTDPPDLRLATRDRNFRWALVYSTVGKSFSVNMSKLKGEKIGARWFNPSTGTYDSAGTFPARGHREFDPPGPVGKDHDWVLVLEARGS